MTTLSVNLNAVAQLRNRRAVPWPSVIGIARLVLDAGARGITIHPRPDQRHIRRTDVWDLQALLRNDYPDVEYNIEGYPGPDFLDLVERAAPDQVTFVPDSPEQATSDHGWDIPAHADLLRPAIARMKKAGIRVSLFIDPDPQAPRAASDVGADRIELYTGPYGGAPSPAAEADELEKLGHAADIAAAIDAEGSGPALGINAGHDLALHNLGALKARLPRLDEVSIGHAITADALIMGFPEAVRRYTAILAG